MRTIRNLTTQLTVITCLLSGSAAIGANDGRRSSDDTSTTNPLFYVAFAGANADDVSIPEELASQDLIVVYQHAFGIYPLISPEGKVYNGGVPQQVKMSAHLREVARDIEEQIPDPNYDGFVVIDYESWPPFWEDTTSRYKDMSRDLVRQAHPGWDEARVERKARTSFEAGAKKFISRTLDKCHAMRPNAKWGMFGYPMANMRNNEARWLWDRHDAIFPEIYMQYSLVPDDVEPELGEIQERIYIRDRLVARVEYARELAGDRPVLPFIWPRYRKSNPNQWLRYRPLKQSDLAMALEGPLFHGADGVVIWENIPQPELADAFQIQIDESIVPEIIRILEVRGVPIGDQVVNSEKDQSESDSASDIDSPIAEPRKPTKVARRGKVRKFTRTTRGGG